MAENKSLVIKIDGNSQGLRDEFNRIKGETKDLEAKLSSIAKTSAFAFAGLTATIVGLTKEFREDEQAALQTEAILKATGFAAGLTSQDIKDLSQSLQDQTTFSDSAVNSAANLLLTFKNLSKDIFPAATEAVLDMATVLGTDAKSSAIQLGKALNDPVQGISALTRAGVQFTETQKLQIETLVKNNDLLAAQKIILGEVQGQMGGAAKAAAEGTGIFIKLGNVFSNIFSSIGENIFNTIEPFAKKLYEIAVTVRDANPELFKLASHYILVATAITGIVTVLATLGIGLLAAKAAVVALGISFTSTWAAATLGLSFLLVPAIIYAVTNLEAMQSTLTGLQAIFTLATDSMQRGCNNVAIAITELLIKMAELGVATLEALPTKDFAEQVAAMKAEISNLARSNELLIQDNKNVKRSFAEIYDEIDAERMAAKVAAQEAAALAERTKGAQLESKRKLAEDGLRLQAEATQTDALLAQKLEAETAEEERRLAKYEKELAEEQLKNENALAAKAAYESTFSEIIRLENVLRALEEGEFNNAQKVRVQAQLDSLKAIRDKSRTEEQKAVTNAQDRIRAAEEADRKAREEAEKADRKAREEAEKKFNKNTVDSTISLGKRIFDEKTAAHKALLLLNQRAALKSAFIDTRQAVMKAFASAPPPASYALAAAAAAFGAIQIADITSTALGLESGGLVGNISGARAGDRYPAMLADGELVVPRKNFEQVVDGAARQRGFVKSGESGNGGDSSELVSRIEISLVDGAADFITAKQLENSRLGVNR